MADVAVDKKALIEGERPIMNASYGKLMMWFFLVSDAFTFSTLLVAYGALRISAVSDGWSWAYPEDVFTHVPLLYEIWHIEAPLLFVGLMTFVLILSSVTMVLAVEAGHRKSQKEVAKWVFWTIIGGAAFLSCQAYEWYHFISGTPNGGVLVPTALVEEYDLGGGIPDYEDLQIVEFRLPGHGQEGEGHEGGDHAVTSLELFNGDKITDSEAIEKILDDAHHTHAGTYYLEKADAERLRIPDLENNLFVKAYWVTNSEGKVSAIRLTNGRQINGPIAFLNEVQEEANHWETQGGANLVANQYGPADFAGLFFFVTGFHGTHVFSGVLLLIMLYLNVRKGTYERRGHYEMTEKIGLYWHFVDLVWVFVFTFFYLI
ncbi:MAG: cytochrome c oxidase subunit 3 [Bacteroidia bacterium]|nr:cytochrome c oxidase subunit 3 [Bacteroidia bacterium]